MHFFCLFRQKMPCTYNLLMSFDYSYTYNCLFIAFFSCQSFGPFPSRGMRRTVRIFDTASNLLAGHLCGLTLERKRAWTEPSTQHSLERCVCVAGRELTRVKGTYLAPVLPSSSGVSVGVGLLKCQYFIEVPHPCQPLMHQAHKRRSLLQK